jgi:C4-type Zn-finger protein
MIQVNSKCPKCGEGIMKLPVRVTQAPEGGPLPEGRVRCTKCGFEDDAIVEAKG